MKIEPSSVAGVDLIGPGTAEFGDALESLLGGEPADILKPALPYAVIARNSAPRAIALLGIRFDMLGRQAKSYSVVHYADTLRYPEKADLTPGAMRFVCAEPLYTDLVLRRENTVDPRGRMNLDRLRQSLRIGSSIDCVAFDDGHFGGPDSLSAFDRFERERNAEIALLDEVLRKDGAIEKVLAQALEAPATHVRDHARVARRVLARRLNDGLVTGGTEEMMARARSHRLRVRLWR